MKKIVLVLIALLVMSCTATLLCPAFAEDGAPAADSETAEKQAPEASAASDNASAAKAIAAGVAVSLAASAGAIGMAIAIGKSAESIARQPEAAGKINSAMMLGLVFIETAIIYALIVAILIIFVL